jgi:biopolymer transport protein ExbD
MKLASRHKADASFSLSSMTDMVFLLLVFFMLTSNFVTPSGLPVNLPTSKNPTVVMQKVSVTISKDLRILVNDRPASFNTIKADLARELKPNEEGVVVLHIDKDVPVEHLVKVASAAAELKAKVSIATKPE